MDNINLALINFQEEKKIDSSTLRAILEKAIRNILRQKSGSSKNFDIIVNPDKGDLEIWRNRTIVEDGSVEEENEQIELSEAKKIEPDFEIGEYVSEKVELKDLGRRAILSLKKNIFTQSKEYYNTVIYKKFHKKIGELIVGEIHYTCDNQNLIIRDDNKNEMILPKKEQMANDLSRKSGRIRALIKNVLLEGNRPIIILSRSDTAFLKKLFEQEIPEVFEGLISIKDIVRIPGEKAKVAVSSYDDRIDPVGACVGVRGMRIHSIVKELISEKIDIINYTDNSQLYIIRALSPAKISKIEIDEKNKIAKVSLHPDHVSKTVGRNGQNLRLVSKLTGYKIVIIRDFMSEEDVELTEFSDEIEPWIIDNFKSTGLSTARSILNSDLEDIIKKTKLEKQMILDVLRILREELKK
ncbi:transcription termination factor NusA [Candidatus Walczuchella monophlebidarum]|uniref:Transcription termination/antitermination protein NusA n=1 Tax=Candidatus Walczuchella monophlebidarum TaxID=1415657 RepID=A0A068DP22_9FLAO|nr:transcription termination factor NusA [Candidatus Walczuchella monophlebidarum]AID37500.1 Transcription factor NusA, N-terminal domain protein [Candidatus Walczuchella monophlebidarum]